MIKKNLYTEEPVYRRTSIQKNLYTEALSFGQIKKKVHVYLQHKVQIVIDVICT